MNTVFLLLAEFETSQIPLELICKKYLAMDYRPAARAAAVQQLPFPVFRGGSQKSPWLVNVNDLADYLDAQRAKGLSDWQKMKTATDAA